MSLRQSWVLIFAMGAATVGLFGLSGCPATQGNCDTGTSTVNTYSPFAKWKMIQGYETPRSTADLKLNYDLLVIEKGSRLCAVETINGVLQSSAALYKADYGHDVNKKQLSIQYTEGSAAGDEDQATYSFSGYCENTKMTLTYTSGAVEVYQMFESLGSESFCDPE